MSFPVDVDIVDDDECMRSLLSSLMDVLNYQAQVFSCPSDYLEYMGSVDYIPPKLAIISDVDMPVMSGYDFINAVRKLNPHIRVVIATGSPGIPTLDDYACFYLAKPFDLNKLKKIFQAISICDQTGPNPDLLECNFIDDRNDFCVTGWTCPRNGVCTSRFAPAPLDAPSGHATKT